MYALILLLKMHSLQHQRLTVHSLVTKKTEQKPRKLVTLNRLDTYDSREIVAKVLVCTSLSYCPFMCVTKNNINIEQNKIGAVLSRRLFKQVIGEIM